MQQRIATESGTRTWGTLQKRPLTGFSHGAAGIAYALLRLSGVTERDIYRKAAEEVITYEQSVFMPEIGNWPDLRESDDLQTDVPCGTSWCHGAPGIGLARLGGLAVLDTPQIRGEITTALTTTQTFGLPTLDGLCCGNFGRIELLIAASQRLHQPHLGQMARLWSSVLIRRAKRRGGFQVLPQLPPQQAYNPGLFQGYAGIGYELLRVAFPDKVPSILLWE